MRFLILGCLMIASQPLWADKNPVQAIFVSVDGDVQVITAEGKQPIAAQEDMTVSEGARIIARTNSTAVLRFFDGSEITVSPRTEFQLTQLQKLSKHEKVMRFDLFIGRLSATVKALMTAKSSFEIEAGGVVCAVRGTVYQVECEPRLRKLLVIVDNGHVVIQQPGHSEVDLTAGQHRIIDNIHVILPKGTSLSKLTAEVESAAASAAESSPLNNPALKAMVNNSQSVNQTNKTNLNNTIQQNSSVGVHVGPGETGP